MKNNIYLMFPKIEGISGLKFIQFLELFIKEKTLNGFYSKLDFGA